MVDTAVGLERLTASQLAAFAAGRDANANVHPVMSWWVMLTNVTGLARVAANDRPFIVADLTWTSWAA